MKLYQPSESLQACYKILLVLGALWQVIKTQRFHLLYQFVNDHDVRCFEEWFQHDFVWKSYQAQRFFINLVCQFLWLRNVFIHSYFLAVINVLLHVFQFVTEKIEKNDEKHFQLIKFCSLILAVRNFHSFLVLINGRNNMLKTNFSTLWLVIFLSIIEKELMTNFCVLVNNWVQKDKNLHDGIRLIPKLNNGQK